MPIVSTGKTISTTEYLNRKQKARRRRQIIISSLLGLLLVGLIIVSRLPQFQIRTVNVVGAEVTGEDAVREGVEERLNGSYLWIVPHRNVFVYGKDRMREELALRFPRFSSIEISLDGFNAINIEVVERDPFALYCKSAELCWFIDERGYVFDSAPSFSEGVYFVYKTEPALDDPLGQFMVDLSKFAELSKFISSLKTLGVTPLSALISPADLVVQIDGGGTIRLAAGSDLEHTFANLSLFLKSPAVVAQQDFLTKFSELDLRTEDKVFYRFHE
jgi:hypothetical protein